MAHCAALRAFLCLPALLPLASGAQAAGALRHTLETLRFPSELHGGVEEALRCGAEGCFPETVPEHLEEVTSGLRSLWSSLPKNAHGRVSWRMLRRLAHRYFLQRSSIMLRGFEPTRQITSKERGLPDVLDAHVPKELYGLLKSRPAAEYGFTLEDAVHVVVILERLVFDSQSNILQQAYASWRAPRTGISRPRLMEILEEYVVRWLMGSDRAGIWLLLHNTSLRPATFPHWEALLSFVEGQTKALRVRRQRPPLRHQGHGAMEVNYTFEDAHEIVGEITRSFSSFWESQCTSMKRVLFSMDPHHTGRVPLPNFYSAALESEWHFVESADYLRELGALDETSKELGNQVIIPNYVQAAPNCIVTTDSYFVCCRNECEDIFEEIEAAIGAPMATPSQIVGVVKNISSQETLDDDFAPPVEASLLLQLESIARAHEGQVPLHGRLFAQWLHYLYPHQCPYPHKMGHASVISPADYGDNAALTMDEVQKLVDGFLKLSSNGSEVNASAMASATGGREGTDWMSQWSSEEELLMEDDADDLPALLEEGGCILVGGAVALLLGVMGVFRFFRRAKALDLPLAKTV